ncbi:MAG: heavy-metal-associated domain-containing protein, partial [Bdellovibrionales bacterium]|nr:heavy-metal-associated domain-containing protein [Bdellovibrionales bacterium]
MKRVFWLLVLVFFPLLTFAEGIVVTVEGMVCTSCAETLEVAFSQVESVEKVSVDVDAKRMTIATKDDQQLADDKIREVVSRAG